MASKKPSNSPANIFDNEDDDDYSSYFNKKVSPKAYTHLKDGDINSASPRKAPLASESALNAALHSRRDALDSPAADDDKMLTRRELYLQELQGIQERTLNTTGRSLQVLDETEAVGTAAAQELLVQREQLENADRNLDKMDTTLNQSQKHINHIKSVFGGIKDWWGGKKPDAVPPPEATKKSDLQSFVDAAPLSARMPTNPTSASTSGASFTGTTRLFPTEKPADCLGVLPSKQFESAFDNNLDQMSSGLTKLRMLAGGLGDEIEQQNRMLDSMGTKSERVGVKLHTQQKSLDQILGKKK